MNQLIAKWFNLRRILVFDKGNFVFKKVTQTAASGCHRSIRGRFWYPFPA